MINFQQHLKEIIWGIKSTKKPNLDWYGNKYTVKLTKQKIGKPEPIRVKMNEILS